MSKWFKATRQRLKRTGVCETSNDQPSTSLCKGYLPVNPDASFSNGRYTAKSLLGEGQYSTVWLADDKDNDRPVALKILSSDFYNGGARLFELDVMRRLRDVAATSNHPGRHRVVELLDDFEHAGPAGTHVCLVLPVLGQSVLEQSEQARQSRLPYHIAKKVSRQLLEAVDYIHSECKVLHTDIQISNILMDVRVAAGQDQPNRQPSVFSDEDVQICLTDFGLACWEDEHLTDKVVPPLLRAPELTLDAPWDSSIDIYNLGCLVYYFVTGALPFPGRPPSNGAWTEEDDRLKTIMEIFGSIPEIVLANASRTDHFFDEDRELRRTPKSGHTPLEDVIGEKTRQSSLGDDMPPEEIPIFCDFLRNMLATDPRKRKSAAGLLQHRWLHTTATPAAGGVASESKPTHLSPPPG